MASSIPQNVFVMCHTRAATATSTGLRPGQHDFVEHAGQVSTVHFNHGRHGVQTVSQNVQAYNQIVRVHMFIAIIQHD